MFKISSRKCCASSVVTGVPVSEECVNTPPQGTKLTLRDFLTPDLT